MGKKTLLVTPKLKTKLADAENRLKVFANLRAANTKLTRKISSNLEEFCKKYDQEIKEPGS